MPTYKIYIETTISADTPSEARAIASTYLINLGQDDLELAVAAVERGYTANPSSYERIVVEGRESRDRRETECEVIGLSHGWVQINGVIQMLTGRNDTSYDSWAECCREEGLTEKRDDTFAEAVESTVGMAQSGAIGGGNMADRRVPRYGPGETMEVEAHPLDPNDPCHPVMQRIQLIQVDAIEGKETLYEINGEAGIGFGRVTLIEGCTKPGPHCDIPYVRVWSGRESVAEFCQHQIVGIYYFPKG